VSNTPLPKPRVIVKRRKNVGAAHHGGSWKVAFADFMTAMMAFFLVMWITNLNPATRKAIEGYFQDPRGWDEKMAGSIVETPGVSPGSKIAAIPLATDQATQRTNFERTKKAIETVLQEDSSFAGMKDFVSITITQEGLLIEMMDSEESFFFQSGSAVLKEKAQRLFATIAVELAKLPNPIVFQGHTDITPYGDGRTAYTNWELSTDRANAVRRVMVLRALPDQQVAEVRGFGPTKLRNPENPTHFSNRRVSILARFLDGNANSLDTREQK
jgi:chemotaxis protein MotB